MESRICCLVAWCSSTPHGTYCWALNILSEHRRVHSTEDVSTIQLCMSVEVPFRHVYCTLGGVPRAVCLNPSHKVAPETQAPTCSISYRHVHIRFSFKEHVEDVESGGRPRLCAGGSVHVINCTGGPRGGAVAA